MTFDINSISASFIFAFLKENWDELVLLGYTIARCVDSIKSLIERDFYGFLVYAAVYFPTFVFLAASLFFNISRMMFTGYVVSASLMFLLLVNLIENKNESEKKMLSNGMFTVILCGSLIFG